MTIARRTLLSIPPRALMASSAVALTVGSSLTLAGCGGGSNTAVNGFTGGDGSYTHIAPDKRSPVPALAGTTLDGKKLALSDYSGSIVVLNVWGSWCAPCRHEAPALVEAAKQTAGTAQFVGVNTRDLDVAPAQAFVRTFGITYPNLFDPDGALLLAFGQLPPKAIPSTLIVDAQGRAAARFLGEVTTSAIVGAVRDIAAGT